MFSANTGRQSSPYGFRLRRQVAIVHVEIVIIIRISAGTGEEDMKTKRHFSGIGAALGAAVFSLACAVPVLAQLSPGIPGVVAPGVETELVQEGFTFTEGPLGTADGGLYFTDIRANRIHHL